MKDCLATSSAEMFFRIPRKKRKAATMMQESSADAQSQQESVPVADTSPQPAAPGSTP